MPDDDNILHFPHIERIEIEHVDALSKAFNLLGCYRLIGHTPVRLESPIEWANAMAERFSLKRQHGVDPWRVDETFLRDVHVSTVFLGLNHNFRGADPPILFETMVFGGKHDNYQERCSTWEEAEAMHQRAVEMVRQLRVVK
jgi:hypothetical protein